MDLETFQSLPTAEVARLVREVGTKVCVFPINGTRRWFMLEYPEQAVTNFVEAYFQIAGRRHIELYKLFFDHGIDTLLTPIFGPDLLDRGDEYMQLAIQGLLQIAQSPDFLDFYNTYDVRVRVYGDIGRYLHDTPVPDVYDELTKRTTPHHRYRLFFGVFAHDATETIAEIAVRFYQEHHCLPGARSCMIICTLVAWMKPVTANSRPGTGKPWRTSML